MARRLRDESELSRGARNTRRWQHERYAERVEVDGYMVHPTAPHGQLRAYSAYGCRGPLCFFTQKHFGITGELCLPELNGVHLNMYDCVEFTHNYYKDTRLGRSTTS